MQHTAGYLLEDRAYKGLPSLLERDFNIKLTTNLKRDYVEIAPGKYIEVNIIGKAIKNGQELYIIGEAKTQLKRKDIDSFLENIKALSQVLTADVIPILVTYQPLQR